MQIHYGLRTGCKYNMAQIQTLPSHAQAQRSMTALPGWTRTDFISETNACTTPLATNSPQSALQGRNSH